MTHLRALAAFVYDFVVGDDWRLAAGAVVALGGAAALVALGVDAWWWTPALVALVLWLAVGAGAPSRRSP